MVWIVTDVFYAFYPIAAGFYINLYYVPYYRYKD